MNSLELVKVYCEKAMQLCKPVCAVRTLKSCFERYELGHDKPQRKLCDVKTLRLTNDL